MDPTFTELFGPDPENRGAMPIPFSLVRYRTSEILRADQTWGEMAIDDPRAAVFPCMVRAQRAARRFGFQVIVIPWG